MSIDYAAPNESQLDITKEPVVADAVASLRPDVIINCAAFNLVDKAEQDRDTAFRVNALGAKHLSQAAALHAATLIHFGSDYVFDGLKQNGLYTEGDMPNPLNEYGRSKLQGEHEVENGCEKYLILRLSWVFGGGKQNFIHKLREWARSCDYLKIACDEFSVPTYTETVVRMTMRAVDQRITGIYHLTNSGFCSRYEWAKVILSSLGIEKFIKPVSMDVFDLPAKRPKFSAMSNGRLAALLNADIPAWEDAVRSFLQKAEVVDG